jgi:hypothetical protein
MIWPNERFILLHIWQTLLTFEYVGNTEGDRVPLITWSQGNERGRQASLPCRPMLAATRGMVPAM